MLICMVEVPCFEYLKKKKKKQIRVFLFFITYTQVSAFYLICCTQYYIHVIRTGRVWLFLEQHYFNGSNTFDMFETGVVRANEY